MARAALKHTVVAAPLVILPHPVQLLFSANKRKGCLCDAERGRCETIILWPVIKRDNDAMHRLTVFVRDSKMRYITGLFTTNRQIFKHVVKHQCR